MKKLLILILVLILMMTFVLPVVAEKGEGQKGDGGGLHPSSGKPGSPGDGPGGPDRIAKKGSGDSGNSGAWSNSPQGDDPGPPGWAGA